MGVSDSWSMGAYPLSFTPRPDWKEGLGGVRLSFVCPSVCVSVCVCVCVWQHCASLARERGKKKGAKVKTLAWTDNKQLDIEIITTSACFRSSPRLTLSWA